MSVRIISIYSYYIHIIGIYYIYTYIYIHTESMYMCAHKRELERKSKCGKMLDVHSITLKFSLGLKSSK